MPAESFYDVHFTTSAKRFYFRNGNRGVSVRDDGLAWTYEGRGDEVNFANIIAVHLQSGGDWRNAISICQIIFRDGYSIAVTNADSLGRYDGGQAPMFRDFAQDFHDRLVRAGRDDIAFTAGYRQTSYAVAMSAALLLGIIALVLPLTLFLWKGATDALWMLPGGAFLIWPLAKMMHNNAPRTYNPRSLPEELLS